MVIGGVWCPLNKVQHAKSRLQKVRAKNNLYAKLKWVKISHSYLEKYKAFLDVFFDTPELNFNCIVVDKHALNYRQDYDNDRELAFYKFYELLLNRVVDPRYRYLIYPDRKNNRKNTRLADLKNAVNNHRLPNRGVNPVRSIEPRPAKDDDLIQMADLLCGAVQSWYNGLTNNHSKNAISRHVAARAKLPSLKVNTPPAVKPVNIWLCPL